MQNCYKVPIENSTQQEIKPLYVMSKNSIIMFGSIQSGSFQFKTLS
jgi:hypothetical protein